MPKLIAAAVVLVMMATMIMTTTELNRNETDVPGGTPIPASKPHFLKALPQRNGHCRPVLPFLFLVISYLYPVMSCHDPYNYYYSYY